MTAVPYVAHPAAGAANRPVLHEAPVSWTHALPLATVTAFGSGFWIVVMRGAVGAIERSSAPFTAWWHESSLLVPFHLAAVLVAFGIAARRYGRAPLDLRRTAAVLALVAAAGTVAGVLLLAGSSVLDYRLQAAALEHMSLSHPGCDAACLDARVAATRDLLVQGVALGGALMALTNLLLAALLVAFRGGRVVVVGTRVRAPARLSSLDLVLAAALVGSAAIHAAVAPAHFGEWVGAGVFFVLLAAGQGLAGVAVLTSRRGPTVPALLVAASLSAAPLALWLVSRTAGLPVGPEAGEAEPVGVADVMACVLELVALAAALGVTRARNTRARTGTALLWEPYRLASSLVALLALTAIGVGSSGVPGFESLAGVSSHLSQDEETVLP